MKHYSFAPFTATYIDDAARLLAEAYTAERVASPPLPAMERLGGGRGFGGLGGGWGLSSRGGSRGLGGRLRAGGHDDEQDSQGQQPTQTTQTNAVHGGSSSMV